MAQVSETCAGRGYGYVRVRVRVEVLLPASFKTSLCSFCSYLSQYLMVLDEKRLVSKGIHVGSQVWVWVKRQIPMGLPMPFTTKEA